MPLTTCPLLTSLHTGWAPSTSRQNQAASPSGPGGGLTLRGGCASHRAPCASLPRAEASHLISHHRPIPAECTLQERPQGDPNPSQVPWNPGVSGSLGRPSHSCLWLLSWPGSPGGSPCHLVPFHQALCVARSHPIRRWPLQGSRAPPAGILTLVELEACCAPPPGKCSGSFLGCDPGCTPVLTPTPLLRLLGPGGPSYPGTFWDSG